MGLDFHDFRQCRFLFRGQRSRAALNTRAMGPRYACGRSRMASPLALLTFAALLVARGDAQTVIDGLTQGVCNATVALRHCSQDPAVADAVRATWAPGLIPDVSAPLYGQPSEYTLFADEVAALIHQLFRDADRKEPHIYDAGGSSGECYFPLLYYVCASAYHECREDRNVTVRVEREVDGSGADGQAITEVVMEKYKVARYPCLGFCQDAQVRRCKDKLVEAMEESLVGLPTLPEYVGNVTDWFNCTKLQESSAYAKVNLDEVCLARPTPPAPPPAPPTTPPPAPPPPPPIVSGAGRAAAKVTGAYVALVVAMIVAEVAQLTGGARGTSGMT
jgi:hypothetical protein